MVTMLSKADLEMTRLTGGNGADRFDCGEGTDVITDFNAAEGDTRNENCEEGTALPPTIDDPQNEDTVGCSFVMTGTFDSDVHDQVEVFVDDSIFLGNADIEGDTWTFVVNVDEEGLTEGEHTFFVIASDSGENPVQSESITVTVECGPDDTTITPPDTECEQATTVTGTFDAEFYDTVEVSVDGTLYR